MSSAGFLVCNKGFRVEMPTKLPRSSMPSLYPFVGPNLHGYYYNNVNANNFIGTEFHISANAKVGR